MAIKTQVKLKVDCRKLTHEQSEYVRIQAVKMVRLGGSSPEIVIRVFGLHRSNIYKWLNKYDQGGIEALKSTRAKGPQPKLTPQQKYRLKKMIFKNPLQLKRIHPTNSILSNLSLAYSFVQNILKNEQTRADV